MCNIYRITSNVEAIRRLFKVTAGPLPNLPELLEVYPNRPAPVIRNGPDGARELASMAWGWPKPDGSPGWVTNVRNLTSPFWRSALASPARRCLVPVTTFCEWTAAPDPVTRRKAKVWFDVTDQPEGFAFAGVWRPCPDGERFAFLTTMANRTVAAIHPKAMPVVLSPAGWTTWMTGDSAAACALAVAYSDDATRVVGA